MASTASIDFAALTDLIAALKKPSNSDTVHKDECMFSFTTPESEGGLYINLTTFQAFSKDFLAMDMERTGSRLYLHSKWKQIQKSKEGDADADADAADVADPADVNVAGAAGADAGPATTATNVQERIDELNLIEYEKTYQISLQPENTFAPYPSDAIPAPLAAVVEAVLARTDATTEAAAQRPDAEKLRVSKYAENLEQLPATKKIPTSGWKCDETGVTENLWLNLSTGFIGSGRPNWQGTGGNGAAMRHFEATGKKYPLVVKLGTVTPHSADVFSYAPDEDDMVEDPHLAKHLAHWGINMASMTKTEKTMEEWELEENMNYKWSSVTEEGVQLQPVVGAGKIGLRNIGQSCYFNSVIQVLMSLPDFQARYLKDDSVFRTAPADPSKDFDTQMYKLAQALLTDKYVTPEAAELAAARAKQAAEEAAAAAADTTTAAGAGAGAGNAADAGAAADAATTAAAGEKAAEKEAGEDKKKGDEKKKKKTSDDEELAFVAPRVLKTLVGMGHEDFSTGQQQDAAEYFLYFLKKIHMAQRASASGGADVSTMFDFETETRTQCMQTNQVSYTTAAEKMWSVAIPSEAASNYADYMAYMKRAREAKAAKAKFKEEQVMLKIDWQTVVDSFMAEAAVADFKSPATGEVGVAKRRTRFKTFPNYLMVQLRKYMPGENWEIEKLHSDLRMPDTLDLDQYRGTGLQDGETEMSAPAGPEPDAAILATLKEFGFSENACKRACIKTNNSGVEAASMWLMEHSGDADFDAPLEAGGAAAAGAATVNADDLAMLMAMGISERHGTRALEETGGDMARAADWAFNHPDEPAAAAGGDVEEAKVCDGPGKYELVAIISHIGKNTFSGHYVCHIKKDGVWLLFNDAKVAVSKTTPFNQGYMYLYKRVAGDTATATEA